MSVFWITVNSSIKPPLQAQDSKIYFLPFIPTVLNQVCSIKLDKVIGLDIKSLLVECYWNFFVSSDLTSVTT